MDILILLARGIVIWLTLSAAIEKWQSGANFENTLARRFKWSPLVSKRAALAVVATETVIGLGMIFPEVWPYFGIAAFLLFALFTAVVAKWKLEGEKGDCGCGGLMPIKDVSIAHAVVLLVIAGMAGITAYYGLITIGSGVLTGLYAGDLLVMFAPLPVLLLAVVLQQILANTMSLRKIYQKER